MSKVEIEELYLTTFDNPFDPQTQSDEWNRFDCGIGYNTNAYVERIVQMNNPKKTTIDVPESEWNKAKLEIVTMFPMIYKLERRIVEVDSIDLIE